MKTTNTYPLWKAIDNIERNELRAAVKAHGGRYDFPSDKRPVVCASFKHAEHPEDYSVTSVYIDKDTEALVIMGEPLEWTYSEDVLYYIEYGHISYITGMIPATEEVSDVSGTPVLKDAFTAVSVSRDDVKALGYNPDLPDSVMQQVAWKLGEYLGSCQPELEDALESLGIPKI